MRYLSLTLVILLSFTSIILIMDEVDASERIGQCIYGRITDSETELPIQGVEVQVYNRTKEIFLYDITDEYGEYSIQIGTMGLFIVNIWHRNYHYDSERVEMERYHSQELDLTMKRYQFNAMGHIYCSLGGPVNYDNITGLFKNTDPNGTDHIFSVDENREIRLNMEPGSYVPYITKPGFTVSEDPIIVDENNITHFSIVISPVDANWDSQNTFLDTLIKIPPYSYAVFTFNISELCNMYLDVRSGEVVNGLSSTHWMYLNYLNYTNKGSISSYTSWELMTYDFAMGGKGFGMSIVAWEDPFHIIIENNNSEPAMTYVTLRYEYAELNYQGVETHPLRENAEQEKEDLTAYYMASILVMAVVISFLTSYLKHRSRQQKTVYL